MSEMQQITKPSEVGIKDIVSYFILSMLLIPAPIIEKINEHLWLAINVFTLFAFIMFLLLKLKGLMHCKIKNRFGIVAVLLFFASVLIPNIVNGVGSNAIILALVRVIFAYLLFVYYDDRNKLHSFIEILAFYCMGLLVANLVSRFVFPSGIIPSTWESWQPQFVLLNPNAFIFYYLFITGVVLAAFSRDEKRSGFVVVTLVVELLTFFGLGDATSETGTLVVLALLVIYITPLHNLVFKMMTRGPFVYFLSVTLVALVSIAGYSGWVISALDNLGIFTGSFVARTEIWSHALGAILQNQGFGAGTATAAFSYGDGGFDRSAHNNFLQIMYYGGVLGIASFIAAMYPVFQKTTNAQNGNKILYGLRLIALMFMIVFLVEQRPFFEPYYYLLLFIPMLFDLSGSSERFLDGELKNGKNRKC